MSRPHRAGRPGLVIVHVVAPAEVGGLERVVQALAWGQHNAGHTVCVASVVSRPDSALAFSSELAGRGVEVVSIVAPGRAYLEERRAIRRLCRDRRPDIVHTHGYRPDVVDAGVARADGIPTVTTLHGFTGGNWRDRLYERVQRAALHHFDAVIAVSAAMGDRLARFGLAKRLHIIPNAYSAPITRLTRSEARGRLGIADKQFHVGWVGRLSREKGPDLLLEALARLTDLSVVASVLGDGPDRESLSARAHSLGVSDSVRWCGIVPEAAQYFAAFDAFVLSSRTEGTPIVLLEAMDARVPIVATRVGGVPELLSGDDAFLVKSEDAEDIANAIRTVHDNRGLAAARAAHAAARMAASFSWGAWVDRYDQVYRSIQR